MKSLSNKIFVTIEKKFQDEIKTESGLIFYKDTSFKPEENSTVVGVVTHIPENVDRLTVPDDFVHNVQVGDKLYFHFNVVLDPDNSFEEDGVQYWIVNYWDAIAIVRDGVIKPVGEFILIDPVIEDEVKSDLLYIPDHIAKKEKTRGTVFSSNHPDIPAGVDVEYDAVGKFWNIIEGKKLYCMFNDNIKFIYNEKRRAKKA